MEWINCLMKINGYDVEARYTKENIETIFMPLIEELEERQKQRSSRQLVFVAAPPACGKSTFVCFLKMLSESMGYHNIQYIGMDGFHYPNEYLDFHFVKGGLLREVKGCPESFDLDKLTWFIQESKTQDLTWPIYDRTIHNPKEEAQRIDKEIVLIEGNYLLLKEEGWKELAKYCEYSIFIQAPYKLLEKRLIDRKAKSTNTREEAIAFYQKSDEKNIHRVLENKMDANLTLSIDEHGIYKVITPLMEVTIKNSDNNK